MEKNSSDYSENCSDDDTCASGDGINILQSGIDNTITFALNNNYYVDSEPHKLKQDNDVKTLELALRKLYKQLALPKLAWLDHGMDLCLSTLYMKLQLDIDKTFIELEELFNTADVNNRLLIEGKPGFGKTTMCIKLLYDWANNASYTQQFQLAALIPLKNLPEEGIEKGLASIIPNFGLDIPLVMNKAGEKVLIVLDGFDELPKNKRQSILRVLYGQTYWEATVIFTCRANEFYVQPEELEDIFASTAFNREFSKVKYTINGIRDTTEVMAFIENVSYVSNINFEFDIQMLKNVAKCNPELFQCPLFVVMFTFLACSNHNIEELNTSTKLYCALLNSIVKHSLIRNKTPISDEFNLFDFKDTFSQKYQRILTDFGQSIITRSMEMILQFDVDHPLIEQVYKLGLLVKHRNMLFLKTTSHYEAFHKSILEFLVAYSIWHKCSELNFSLNDEIIKTVVSIFQQHGNAQTLHFIWGLCETNIIPTLEVLKLYTVYWDVEDFFWEITSRNKVSSELLTRFCNVMPFHCYAPWINVNDLKLSLLSGRIKTVCLFAHENIELPNVMIPQLRLIVTDEKKLANQTFAHLKNIRCSNFIIDFQFRNINFYTFQTCLSSLKVIGSDFNSVINLNSESFNWLRSKVEGITINRVECILSSKELIEFHPCKGFAKTFNSESELKCEITDTLLTVTEMIGFLPTCIGIIKFNSGGGRVEFDFRSLTLDERKEWFQNLKLGDINTEFKYLRLNYLFIMSSNRFLLGSILKFTSSTILRCLFTHLTIAIDALPCSWPGFNHVQGLSLICEEQSPLAWKNIIKFKGLQSLELQMFCKLKNVEHHIDAIVNCIFSLHQHIHLSLHIDLKEDVIFMKSFMEKFNKLSVLRCYYHPLNTISIVSVMPLDHVIIIEILKCVQFKLLLKVQLFISPDNWSVIVRQINIDYSVFQVSIISSGVNVNANSDITEFPPAFSRPPDQTKQVSCVQIRLK